MDYLAKMMSSYHRYHTKDSTKLTHFFGVPAIVFSLQILLSWIHFSFGSLSLSLAWVILFLLVIFYFFLDVYLALVTTFFLVLLTVLAQWVAGYHFNWFAFFIFIVFFIIGWVAQIVGHYYEGNSPAFTHNIFQVFVAPIFLVAELFFIWGYRKDLQKKVLELAKY